MTNENKLEQFKPLIVHINKNKNMHVKNTLVYIQEWELIQYVTE